MVQNVGGDDGLQALDKAGHAIRDRATTAVDLLQDAGVPIQRILAFRLPDWGELVGQIPPGRVVPVAAFVVGLVCREIMIAIVQARRVLGKKIK